MNNKDEYHHHLENDQVCHAPLYHQVASGIRAQLGRRYGLGDSLPTEIELAEEFRVSLITVRGALNLLRTGGYISSGRGRSTRVEKVVSFGPTALLIELDYDHPDMPPFYRHLAHSLMSHLNEKGIEHRLYKGKLKPGDRPDQLTNEEFQRDMEQGRIGGVITISNPSLPWYSRALQSGIPVLGTSVGFRNAVTLNTYGSVDLGIAKLVEAGCQRIAAVGWEGLGDHSLRDYFYRVLYSYGIQGHDHWVKTDIYPLLRGSGWEAFREIWTSRTEKPDGIFIMDGEMLPGLYQSMSELGLKSPRDLTLLAKVTSIPEFKPLDGVLYLTACPIQLGRELVGAYADLLKGLFKGHSFVPYYPLAMSKQSLIDTPQALEGALVHRKSLS